MRLHYRGELSGGGVTKETMWCAHWHCAGMSFITFRNEVKLKASESLKYLVKLRMFCNCFIAVIYTTHNTKRLKDGCGLDDNSKGLE